jgi:translation initiation factor 5B
LGVVLKTDTLGSLEALLESLKARDIQIRLADIGDVSRRDVVEAISVKYEEPLYGAILAFNVKVLPDAEREAYDQRIPIFLNDIIYNLMDDYVKWMESERETKARREFEDLVHPGKIQVLDGFVFRRAKPAIFGVRVLSGVIEPNREMVNSEDHKLGRITQIQESGDPVSSAEEGSEVAVSMPRPVFGRHIKEKDVLYVDIPEQDIRKLREKFASRLTENALDVLMEFVEIKRKKDPIWAM